MKHFILLLLTVSFSNYISAQTLSTDYIKKHTNYFTIENGEFNGSGKKVIKKMINSSQFITYGETHGSEQISLITKAFMPLLKKAGFQHFAIEVGPNSAKKLADLSTPPSETVKNLYAFNSGYTVTQGDETAIPIPFFDGVSDAEFLQVARANGMSLWGLDQEYYFSPFFLMDEMVSTVKGTSDYEKINQLKQLAQRAMYQHFIAEAQNKIDNAYPLIKKEKAVQDFLDAFDKDNGKAQKIISDMKISWDIYIHWRNDSHADRISYMRNNFMKNYNKALQNERTPKVFTKIGSLHAGKLYVNGAFDIGHLTEELAQKNKTKSVSINTWVSFSETEKGLQNNFEKYKRGFKRYTLLTQFAKKDQWTIINLKNIRKDIIAGKINLPSNGDYHKLRKLIFSYDYQLITPIDKDPTLNRKK